MRHQLGLALLTIIMTGTVALDITRLFWTSQPSKAAYEEEPQVVEVVRWRQPVCAAPAKDVPPCLVGLRKLQTEYEQVGTEETTSGRAKRWITVEASSDEITAILSPEVVNSIPLDMLESSEIEVTSLEVEPMESRPCGRTPAMDEEHQRSVRDGKYVVMPAFGKDATFKPPPIYVTKVLDSPVTATLVAQNCFPDIGVPLCEESRPDADKPSSLRPETDNPVQGHRPGNFWEDPASPHFDGAAATPIKPQQVSETPSKAILHGVHGTSLQSEISSKPAVGHFVNIKQSVQSVFDLRGHNGKQGMTAETLGSAHGNGDGKIGIIESIHSLLGKGSINGSPVAGHGQGKPSVPADIGVTVGKITENVKKGQTFLQSFHDLVKRPQKEVETSTISETIPVTDDNPDDSKETHNFTVKMPAILDEKHSLLQTLHDIVKKPLKKVETSMISQTKPLAYDKPESSRDNVDIDREPSEQSTPKHPLLQTIQQLVSKPYRHFRKPIVTGTTLSILNKPDVIVAVKQPEVKPVLVIEPEPTPKPSLFEHFWLPGAIFEVHTTTTANPASWSTTTESPATDDDWHWHDKGTTASDSNVGESISETLIEVPEGPASASVARQPENGVEDKESGVPAEEPGLLDTSNPVKATFGRGRRDLSKAIFGSFGHALAKSTNQPLLVHRPNQKPLLVEQPIYVVRKPTTYGRWWNIFSRPSPSVVDSNIDHEVVTEPVYIYQKPEQRPGVFGSFFSKSSFPNNWSILGNHHLLNNKLPAIDSKFVEINGQTSTVVRYPQKPAKDDSQSDAAIDASEEDGSKNVLDNQRPPAQALDN